GIRVRGPESVFRLDHAAPERDASERELVVAGLFSCEQLCVLARLERIDAALALRTRRSVGSSCNTRLPEGRRLHFAARLETCPWLPGRRPDDCFDEPRRHAPHAPAE